MLLFRKRGAAVLSAAGLTSLLSGLSPALGSPQDYRFEMVGKPQPSAAKQVVLVRLVHTPDNKSVTDAVLFESKADMSPMGMAIMIAPITWSPSAQAGLYRLEIEPGMSGTWAINLAAKVQGEVATVRGTITTDLVK